MKMMVIMVLAAFLAGCAGFTVNERPAEMSQQEYIRSGYRAGAEVVVANQYQATNADVYIYLGNRSKEELLLNINGQNVVLKEHVNHFWLMNAASSHHPTVVSRLLDVNKCYTLLQVVHWGIGGDYTVDTDRFCTTTDSTRVSWRDGFGRPYYANVIIRVPGTDQAALDRFNPVINIYPNQVFRQLLNGGRR